jgi:hypothetical protein
VPLVDIDISINGSVLPDDVVAFLREADFRVSQFVRNSPIRLNSRNRSRYFDLFEQSLK